MISINLNKKLKHYYVTGVLIEPGQFVDRHGNVVIITDYDQFESDNVVPIYYEHGGPIVGFATRFYTANGQLCFDGYVFDPHVLQLLLSSRPGVSAELIKTNDGWVITGIALTKNPAVESASIQGVIALSSLRDELKQFLEDNGFEQADKIAALVEKFLAQFKYPSPQLKQYEAKLSEAAQTINELNQLVEEKDAEIAELQARCKSLEEENEKIKKEMEAKIKELEQSMLQREIEALINEIKALAPDVDLEAAPQDPQAKLQFLKSLLNALRKIVQSGYRHGQGKLEFSAYEDDANSDLDEWDRVINTYLSQNK